MVGHDPRYVGSSPDAQLREPLLTDNAPASLWQAGRQALLLLWLWLVRRCRRFASGRGPFLGRPAAQ